MNLVVLKTFDNYFSANILLTKLQDCGIECYLKDEYTVTIDPILTNAIGGIKLVVKDSDEVEARKMLMLFEDEYAKSAVCPTCGKSEFTLLPKQTPQNILSAIGTWILSSFAIAPDYVYTCGNCGYESERLPESTNE
jgi:predicted RNA-binding Zn-ribbon protein involved in translation (DUF1610 family)